MMPTFNFFLKGKSLDEATHAMIFIHGRGGTAEDVLSLSGYFPVQDFSLLAPQAETNTWYPYSFNAPQKNNEPWLSDSISLLHEVVLLATGKGVHPQDIFFCGFSQGACLMLEYLARNANRYGGAIAFTGGLIGDKIDRSNYNGRFDSMPVFLSSGNKDPHVPLERIKETVSVFEQMGASVMEKIFPLKPHSITMEEIRLAEAFVFKNNMVS